jgi:two-component system NtrC family sensor kinase
VHREGSWRGTLVRRRGDGTTFPSASSVAALRDRGGAITHFVHVERDATADLALRDQMIQNERLAATAELVAGVAHEINNPLQTIVGRTELLMDQIQSVDSRRDLEFVRVEAARAGQIVRNLLAFVRRTSFERTAADLTELVRRTVSLRTYHLKQKGVEIELALEDRPLPVHVSVEEIQQVFLNLLLNAEHAILSTRPYGTIRIRTGAGEGIAWLEVADDGPGVPPELKGRIFEPFFTTKEVGQGTGLGLSISIGIASSHGGSLRLEPAAAGACFRLSLPLVARANGAGIEGAPPFDSAQGAPSGVEGRE